MPSRGTGRLSRRMSTTETTRQAAPHAVKESMCRRKERGRVPNMKRNTLLLLALLLACMLFTLVLKMRPRQSPFNAVYFLRDLTPWLTADPLTFFARVGMAARVFSLPPSPSVEYRWPIKDGFTGILLPPTCDPETLSAGRAT